MKYTHIFFDLDGTLTDPALGITNSVMHALRRMGRQVPPREELLFFIGPPLLETFESYCELDRDGAIRAVELYREHYHDKGIFENRLYTGISELLSTLNSSGYVISLATSKPEVYAKRILEHFEIDRYFAHVCGANLDGTRTDKSEVIKYALESAGNPPLDNCLMIGDRKHDVLGAKKIGLDCLGVLYGYGSREELVGAGADYISETVTDIADFFNKA